LIVSQSAPRRSHCSSCKDAGAIVDGPTTTAHGVLVGWSAARAEHRGRRWQSGRELALDPERWAAPTRCERGYTQQLPDLAAWINRSHPPVAVIAESGGRREDRQKMILEGWRDAILAGRYAGVRYDCANTSVARWIGSLARKVGLASPSFSAVVQLGGADIAALPPAAPETEPDPNGHEPAIATIPERETLIKLTPENSPAPTLLAPDVDAADPAPISQPETPDALAERERVYLEILGLDEPKPRRPVSPPSVIGTNPRRLA
jgi:hypothetical protein